jgi:peptidoglycan/xylan/chitin deacetylase (PgdA/CDA1 family)
MIRPVVHSVARSVFGGSSSSWKSYWNKLSKDGYTWAWFDASDLTTITKDGSDLVSKWNDKLGSGHDLKQTTGSKQPKWDKDNLLFDGIGQFMLTDDDITGLIQPEFIYIVFKQVTWTVNDPIFDGTVTAYGELIQSSTTPGLKATAGTASSQKSLPIETYGIVRVLFNGASSKLQINNLVPLNWNCGANNMGCFTLGTRGATTTNYSNIQVKEIIIRTKADIDSDETIIYNYLNYKNKICSPEVANTNIFNNAKLILTFDDGKKTLIDNGLLALLQTYGVSATCYLVSDWMGVDNSTMTWANAQSFNTAGIDLQCHTKDHPNMTTLTDAQIQAQLQEVNTAFINNSLPIPLHIAYPGGAYNDSVKTSVATLRRTGRAEGTTYTVYPKSDKFVLPSMGIDNVADYTVAIKAQIDQAVLWKTALILRGHGLSDLGDIYEVKKSTLSDIINYAQSVGMDIITITQLYALMK